MSLVHQAVMAVASGTCNYVVGYRAMNGRSGARYSAGVGPGGGAETPDLIQWSWYMPYGFMTPTAWVATHMRRYMHDYNAGYEGLAEVAVTQRTYACNHPMALFYGRPITFDDYYNAKWTIVMQEIKDDAQLDAFIKARYGAGCSLDEKTPWALQENVFDVGIEGDDKPMETTECLINYATVLKYYPDGGKVISYPASR